MDKQESALLKSTTQPSVPENSSFEPKNLKFLFVKLPTYLILKRKLIVDVIFRCFTLLSLFYLIYDRYYETDAVITAPVSDPNNPFFYPFSLTNSSHLFYIRNVDWGCQILEVRYENGSGIKNAELIFGRKPSVGPGGTSHIYCNKNGFSFNSKLVGATIRMQAQYDVDMFGVYTWRRTSAPTTFTWLAGPTESRRQWIKGDP